MERYLLIAGFGALGAMSRYALDGWVSHAPRGQFPWGTLAINVRTVQLVEDSAYALALLNVAAMTGLGLLAAAAGLLLGRAL